ncbi:hypothetical protein [Nonomuraea sp. NPDC003201]
MTTMLIGFVAFATALTCVTFGVKELRLISRLRRYGVHGRGRVIGAVVDDSAQHPVIAYLDGQSQAARVFTTRYRVLPIVLAGIAGLISLGAGIAVIAVIMA